MIGSPGTLSPMDAALEVLLDGVIDYAGLFPPAKLGMADAVAEFLSHIDGEEGVLVNRFVCPASRLAELSEHLETDAEFGVTVIGSGLDQLDQDRGAMAAFEDRWQEQILIEGYETRAGDEPGSTLNKIRPITNLDCYVEVALDDKLPVWLDALASSELVAAKLRTGGLTADSFPTPEQLADFIGECLDLNLAFKLTAGLHHPIRRADPETGGTMHGFLNVLIGTALAEQHDLSRREIAAILREEDARAFEVTATAVGWRGEMAGLPAIDSMRTLFSGFGSCSVNEPVEDLKSLGLW